METSFDFKAIDIQNQILYSAADQVIMINNKLNINNIIL